MVGFVVFAVATVDSVVKDFRLLKLLQAVLHVNKIVFLFIFEGGTGMVENFIGLRVVLFFDQTGVPLNGQVALLKEVFYVVFGGREDAATAQFHPAALRALIPLSLHSLQYEWLESSIWLADEVFPVLLFPP